MAQAFIEADNMHDTPTQSSSQSQHMHNIPTDTDPVVPDLVIPRSGNTESDQNTTAHNYDELAELLDLSDNFGEAVIWPVGLTTAQARHLVANRPA